MVDKTIKQPMALYACSSESCKLRDEVCGRCLPAGSICRFGDGEDGKYYCTDCWLILTGGRFHIAKAITLQRDIDVGFIDGVKTKWTMR